MTRLKWYYLSSNRSAGEHRPTSHAALGGGGPRPGLAFGAGDHSERAVSAGREDCFGGHYEGRAARSLAKKIARRSGDRLRRTRGVAGLSIRIRTGFAHPRLGLRSGFLAPLRGDCRGGGGIPVEYDGVREAGKSVLTKKVSAVLGEWRHEPRRRAKSVWV